MVNEDYLDAADWEAIEQIKKAAARREVERGLLLQRVRHDYMIQETDRIRAEKAARREAEAGAEDE